MTANTVPIFTDTPVLGKVAISTANTGRDGAGTMGTVLTGGSDGTRITRITLLALVTTTAGMIRLFIGDDAGSPVINLWREVAVTVVVPSGSAVAWSSTISLPGELALVLPVNYTLRAATNNAEAFVVVAEGGNY